MVSKKLKLRKLTNDLEQAQEDDSARNINIENILGKKDETQFT